MSETKTYGTVHGYDVVDVPETGYYIAINSQDTEGDVTKKAVLISANDLHEDKNYCTLNYTVADYKGNMSGVFIVSGSEGNSGTPKTEPSSDHKAAWTVDITSPVNTPGTNFDVTSYFSDEQKSAMTDDNTAGVNADGVGRKIHVYFLGTAEKPIEDYELPWVENAGEKNDKVFNDLKALGFEPGVDAPFSGYYLDSALDLQMDYTNKSFKLRVTYEP